MKSLILIFLSFTFVCYAQSDERYTKAMKQNLSKMDNVTSAETYVEIANSFERIAKAEKDKWLPYYYTSLNYVLASYADSSAEGKDLYLDKADKFISLADSLEPDNSEVYTLMGMISQARLQVDPMNRWQKYGALSNQYFGKAMEADSLNPRPEYLMGVSIYYTPANFGGGPAAATPLFLKSKEKFDKYERENELMPDWGKEHMESLLKEIENTTPPDTLNQD